MTGVVPIIPIITFLAQALRERMKMGDWGSWCQWPCQKLVDFLIKENVTHDIICSKLVYLSDTPFNGRVIFRFYSIYRTREQWCHKRWEWVVIGITSLFGCRDTLALFFFFFPYSLWEMERQHHAIPLKILTMGTKADSAMVVYALEKVQSPS